MARQTAPRIKPDPVTLLWLQNQFDKLNRKLDLLLIEVKARGLVSPELEAEINKAATIARRIDRMVPDQKAK